MTAKLDAFSSTSIFGVRSSATNGFDPAFDRLPPPNPFQGVTSWFYYPDNPNSPINLRRLSTSMIPEASSMVWTYQVLSVGLDGTVQITWSPSEIATIPSKYGVYLQDSTGTTLVNMRTAVSYSYISQADATVTFIIKLQLRNLAVFGVSAWYWTSDTIINSVATGDVDADGQTEIVTGGTYFDGARNVAQLIIWSSSSLVVEKLTAWYWTDNTTINSVALGDVDGDDQTEIVTGGCFYDGTRDAAQLIEWNGATLTVDRLTGWYWTGNTVINSVSLGDIDGDDQVEIVTGGYYNDGSRNVAQLIEWNGANLAVDRLTAWYWTDNTVIKSVAVGDADNDGQTEVVTGGYYNDGVRNIAQLIEWNGATLAVDRLTGWYWTSNTVINSVVIGDVDSDGQTEVVTGGYYNDNTRNIAQLIEWNGATLTVDRLTGWYWTDNTVINSVTIGDVDGNDQTEIFTGGYYNDGTCLNSQLIVWGME